MYKTYLGLKFAFSYFSIIPMSFKKEDDLSHKKVLAYILFFLPLVGLVLGSLSATLFSFLESLTYLGAIIAACFYMLLYGFIHTEAIIDVVDASYAKHSGKDAYEVIKEPTIGAMGLLYSCIFTICKVASIAYMFLNGFILEFVAVLIISRLMLTYLIYLNDFKSSFVNVLKEAFTLKLLALSSFVFLLLSLFVIGFNIIYLYLLALVFCILFLSFLKNKLGFLNGDTLGCTLESCELFLFLAVLLWL